MGVDSSTVVSVGAMVGIPRGIIVGAVVVSTVVVVVMSVGTGMSSRKLVNMDDHER